MRQSTETQFEQLLKAELSQEQLYLSDDGFTARVLTHLPRKRKLPATAEFCIKFIPSVLITLLVLRQMEFVPMFLRGWLWFMQMNIMQLMQLSLAFFVCGILGVIYWLGQEMQRRY